jgi:hypothetical protein
MTASNLSDATAPYTPGKRKMFQTLTSYQQKISMLHNK